MYAVRTTPANCDDQILCSRLGFVSVHGVMAGFTDFSVGMVRNAPVYIPVDIIVDAGSKRMKRNDLEWQRLVHLTGQTNLLSPDNYESVLKIEKEQLAQRMQNFINIKHRVYGGEKNQHRAGITGEDES